jgi:hypothetical protein
MVWRGRAAGRRPGREGAGCSPPAGGATAQPEQHAGCGGKPTRGICGDASVGRLTASPGSVWGERPRHASQALPLPHLLYSDYPGSRAAADEPILTDPRRRALDAQGSGFATNAAAGRRCRPLRALDRAGSGSRPSLRSTARPPPRPAAHRPGADSVRPWAAVARSDALEGSSRHLRNERDRRPMAITGAGECRGSRGPLRASSEAAGVETPSWRDSRPRSPPESRNARRGGAAWSSREAGFLRRHAALHR